MIEDDLRTVFLLWPRASGGMSDAGDDLLAERIVDLYIYHPEFCFTALRRKKIIGFVMGGAVDTGGCGTGSVAMITADAGGRSGQVYGMLFARLLGVFDGAGICVVFSEPLAGDDVRREVYRVLGFETDGAGPCLKYEIECGG